MNQAVIRETQSCPWDRVICILYCCVTVIQYITVSGGTCDALSVFWQFTGEICFIKYYCNNTESGCCCSVSVIRSASFCKAELMCTWGGM